MCLYSLNIMPKVAEEDIEVYKVLKLKANGKYYAPFMNDSRYTSYTYHKGVNEPEKLFDPKYKYEHAPYCCFGNIYYEVSRGWLHAYRREEDAKQYVRYNPPTGYELAAGIKKVVVKMIIPKGSEYYVNFNGSEIAADKLVWNK